MFICLPHNSQKNVEKRESERMKKRKNRERERRREEKKVHRLKSNQNTEPQVRIIITHSLHQLINKPYNVMRKKKKMKEKGKWSGEWGRRRRWKKRESDPENEEKKFNIERDENLWFKEVSKFLYIESLWKETGNGIRTERERIRGREKREEREREREKS